MKIGRNDPCPCGSGKKHKRCCLNSQAAPSSPADPTAEVKADLNRFLEEKRFDSLEDLQEHVQSFNQQRNQTPRDDFHGLSPEQMYRFLNFPFDTPELVTFPPVLSLEPSAPIITLFSLLADALDEKGLKTTATGNLPRNFCREAAHAYQEDEIYKGHRILGGINSETDFFDLHTTRLTAQLAGLIRKYRGRFVLTKKCAGLLANTGMQGIYPLLLETHVRKFNWAYRDHYPELGIVQQSFLFSLYLLIQYGHEWRHTIFYEDCFLRAFPMVVEEVEPRPIFSPKEDVRSCYTWRCLQNFAAFFGLAQVEPVSKDILNREYRTKKLPLLEQAVFFQLSN